MMKTEIVTVDTRPWCHPEEDRIVGKMMRDLLSYEGKMDTPQLRASLDAVIVCAIQEAVDVGANPEWVKTVARRLTIR